MSIFSRVKEYFRNQAKYLATQKDIMDVLEEMKEQLKKLDKIYRKIDNTTAAVLVLGEGKPKNHKDRIDAVAEFFKTRGI